MKKVSVIIPCFNQGRFIEQTIRSVLESTYENVELIVVNDGSTDQFTNLLLANKQWEKTFIYYITNSGISSARNFGIAKSSGDYILDGFIDFKIELSHIVDRRNGTICLNLAYQISLKGTEQNYLVAQKFLDSGATYYNESDTISPSDFENIKLSSWASLSSSYNPYRQNPIINLKNGYVGVMFKNKCGWIHVAPLPNNGVSILEYAFN